MGKFAILMALLVGCGDNIHPAPDASRPAWVPEDPRDDVTVKPPYDNVLVPVETPEGPCTDPEPVDTCDDKHIDINGHEHKCQHHSK